MINRILFYYFIISLLFIFFVFGYFAHKYQFKNIYDFVDSSIISLENFFDINLDNILLESNSPTIINKRENENFKLENKPKKNFDFLLLLKLDNSNFRLMKSPDTAVWNWNLKNFRRPEIMMPIYLFPNGDIIIAKFNNKGVYKIDKNGKILWKSNEYFHHWGSYHDNNLYLPSRDFKNISNIKNKFLKPLFKKRCNQKDEIIFDTILVTNKNTGKVIKKISLLSLIDDSNIYDQLIIQLIKNNFRCENVLHLNDVIVLNKEQAGFFPFGKEGDLIVSFRQINLIALIDKDTNKIKWEISGSFNGQHSPRITDKGSIIVFDNLFKRDLNNNVYVSRILELDIKTKKILGFFDNFEEIFYSEFRGRVQLIDNRLFVQSSSQGEIFEIICASEYLSKDCNAKYVYSAIYSDFYNHDVYNSLDEKNDQLYLGDFYSYKDFYFLDNG